MRVLLAIDQAETSGYAVGFAHDDGRFALHQSGVVSDPEGRESVLLLADSLRIESAQPFIACLEDHSDFYFGRGNASAKSLLGMGAERGRWEEQLDRLPHPKKMRCKVTPKVWRKAVLGLPSNVRAEHAKALAVQYAKGLALRSAGASNDTRLFTADEAEAICIAVYAARALVPTMLPKTRRKKVA